jgi:hypothetical protein
MMGDSDSHGQTEVEDEVGRVRGVLVSCRTKRLHAADGLSRSINSRRGKPRSWGRGHDMRRHIEARSTSCDEMRLEAGGGMKGQMRGRRGKDKKKKNQCGLGCAR